MRRSAQKRNRQQFSQTSPNKEFLLKFLSKNYERETLNQQYIRSFNFYLSKQIERINKNLTTIGQQIEACIMLLSSLISSLEFSTDISLFTCLNDTFYLMMEFVLKCLQCFNSEKTFKNQQWEMIDNVLDLLEVLNKNPKKFREPNRDDNSDKKLQALNWIDEIPEIIKNSKIVMNQEEKINSLKKLLLTNSTENYKLIVRSSFECYLNKYMEIIVNNILSLIQTSLVYRKSQTTKKALQLFLKLRNSNSLTGSDLISVFERIRIQDPKVKSIKHYRQIIQIANIENYLTQQQIFNIIMEILKEIMNTISQQLPKQVVLLLNSLQKLSFFFSEITSQIKHPNLYQTMLSLLITISEKLKQDEDRVNNLSSACNSIKGIYKNILNNKFLKINVLIEPEQLPKVIASIEKETSNEIQKFVISTLPDLVTYAPAFHLEQSNNFIMAIYLKIFINYINKNPRKNISQLFLKYYKLSQQKQPINNFSFAMYFCLLSALDQQSISQNKIIDILMQNSIQKLTKNTFQPILLLADLVLLINLVNRKQCSILRCSAKEFTDKLFSNLTLLTKELVLPSILTNQALLFSEHLSLPLDQKIITLANLLNQKKNLLIKQHSEIFYYVLIEVNKFSEQTSERLKIQHHKSQQIEIIRRIKASNSSNVLSLCCSSLQSSIKSGNKIQIFHSLTKIYSIVQNKPDDQHLLANLQSLLYSLLIDMYIKYPITNQQILELYNTKTKKKEGHLQIFNHFIAHNNNKQMHVVKFYSEAKNQTKRLHIFIMQMILRILIKTYKSQRSAIINTAEFKKIHLLYLPIQSPYIDKSYVSSDLQLAFLSMYLVTLQSLNPPNVINSMKEYLLKQFNKISQFYSDFYKEMTNTIRFNDFDFVKYLLDKFLIEFEQDKQITQNSFVYTMLSLLSSDKNVLNRFIEEIQNSKFVQNKIPLLFKRLKYQLKYNNCTLDNSKTIYNFLEKVNPNCSIFNLNHYVNLICQLDDFKDPKISIYICKQLSLMKNLFLPDQDMVNNLFQYVAKMNQFYQNLTSNQNLLIVIPQMICQVFAINSKSQSEISVSALNQLEKIDKTIVSCTKNGNNSGHSSYYRCIECQEKYGCKTFEEKRYICYGCIVACHQGHTYYYVSTNSRGFCQCSVINNGCRLKKNQQDQRKKEMIGRPIPPNRDYGALHEIPRQIRQMREIRSNLKQTRDMLDSFREGDISYGRVRGAYDQLNSLGNVPVNPLSYFNSYGSELEDHPFNRRQVQRYDKFSYQIRDSQWDDDNDERMNSVVFKAIQKKIKQPNEPIVQKIEQKTQLRSDFLKQKAQMQIENPPQSQQQILDKYEQQQSKAIIQQEKQNIIRHQSYLLHIFIGIVQQRFTKQNRKVSIHQVALFKLPTQPPALTKLSENFFKLYSTNFKTKMNLDNGGGHRASPMIVRKPIAISEKLILVLCSLSIHVFQAKKFLSHICNFANTQPEYLYRHDLLIQAHSIQFIPNNPGLLCVAGLKTIHILSIGNDNTISKSPVNTYDNNNGDVINKIQALEIGILISDARSIRLIDLTSKSVLMVIPPPKEGGVMKDWYACKELNSKSLFAYSLLVISSYGSIFHIQFDENDRGQKQLNKKLNGHNDKKGETGVSMFQCNLYDGRKLMLAGIKDSQSNLIGIIENDTLISSTFQKFNTLFNNPSLFGHMQLVESSPQRIVFACTLKDGAFREMSIHAGNLCLISLTKSQKLQIQQLQFHAQNIRCEGMSVWNIDKDIKIILSITEDGSVYMHSVGKLLKQNILKYLGKMEDKPSIKDDSNKNIDDIRKTIFSKLNLNVLSKVQLNPIVEFAEKSAILKKGTDYNIEKGNNLITVHLTNFDKMITGLSFGQSSRVILPTRTIDNVLEVGFSILQCLYFYANGLKFTIQGPSKSIVSRDNEYNQFDRRELSPGQFQVLGEVVNSSNPKIKKIQALLSKVNGENSSMHVVQIFKILQIFLKQIKETQNYMIEDTELKFFIDSMKNLISQVNEQYYLKLRNVIILCLEIYNAMTGETDLRADNPLHPYTLPTETVLNQIQSFNITKTNLLLDDLYELAEQQPQVFFYLFTKYHKLPQKLYKKYALSLTKENDKEKQKYDSIVAIPDNIQKLFKILVASLNLKRKSADRDDVLLLIKNIFAKYSGSKSVRKLLYQSIVKYYNIKPQDWIQRDIKSVEQQAPAEVLIDPTLKNMLLGSGKFNHYLSEDQLMQMDELEQEKYAIMMDNMIQEEKMDFEQQNQMDEMEQEPIIPLNIQKSDIAGDIFIYSMRPYQNEDSYQTAYDYLLMAYTCFKATQNVNIQAVEQYLSYIAKSLKKINIQKILPSVVIAYIALFSEIIQKSKALQQSPTPAYNEIKEQVLKLVDSYLQKNQSIFYNSCIGFSHALQFKPIVPEKINIPHTLLRLLKKPVQPTPSILFVKFYSLLPESKQFYKVQRDKIIFQKSMRTENIQSLYKKAKKAPESWKKFADVEWLQKFIQNKKPGWEQALELLSIYYDQ